MQLEGCKLVAIKQLFLAQDLNAEFPACLIGKQMGEKDLEITLQK